MRRAALQQGVDQINFTQSFVGAARTPTSERVKQVPDRCKAALAALAARLGTTPDTLGIAVGIHGGQLEIGEFSTFRSDFTAIGGIVNLAGRPTTRRAPGAPPNRSPASRNIEHTLKKILLYRRCNQFTDELANPHIS
jgi:hypothetical protein